jgi:hypothetical protein
MIDHFVKIDRDNKKVNHGFTELSNVPLNGVIRFHSFFLELRKKSQNC